MRKPLLDRLLIALLGGAVAAGALVALGFRRGDSPAPTVIGETPASSVGAGFSPRAIYARDGAGVVYVVAKVIEQTSSPFALAPTKQTGAQTGSGFFIAANGTILTNAHVIDGALRITVQLADGTVLPARVIGKDPDDDLALLQVNPSGHHIDVLALGNSANVAVGDPTVAIGNPFGFTRTLTTGVVSALARQIQAPNGFTVANVIQTDAPINPGNSGGPLINAAGQVIGINSQIETAGGSGNVGIGFAIPINTAKFVIPQLEEHGRAIEGYLGVATASVTPALATAHLRASYGAIVESVTSGSPAARAGLRASRRTVTLADGVSQMKVGGDIIVAFDGRPVRSDAALEQQITHEPPGTRVTLGILRGSSHLSVPVTLGTRPESLSASG
jgi:S1-C subfamily serine protease